MPSTTIHDQHLRQILQTMADAGFAPDVATARRLMTLANLHQLAYAVVVTWLLHIADPAQPVSVDAFEAYAAALRPLTV